MTEPQTPSLPVADRTPATTSSADALHRRELELQVLHRLSQAALTTQTSAALTELALAAIMEGVAPEQTFFYRANQGELILQGTLPEEGVVLPERKSVGLCLCGMAASARQAIYSPDIDDDARYALSECKAARVRSFAALPLTVDQELVGVLGLAATTRCDFAQQGPFLETLAAIIALTVKKTTAVQESEERSRELENRVVDRTAELVIRSKELERLNKLFVDREFRIKELKERLKALEQGAASSSCADRPQAAVTLATASRQGKGPLP